MTCALLESDKPALRYIHIKGNHTIFSVPEETQVYIKCDDPSKKHKSVETTFNMVNMGQITFRPGCTVNFPDGTKFQTPSYFPTERIEDLKLFEILDVYSIPKNARIKRFYDHHYHEPELLDVEYKFPSLAELKNDILHPTKALGFVVKFIILCLIIAAITLTCLCYWRPIRVCLGKSSIFVCFDPVQPEEVNDPLHRKKLKGILKSGLVKAKSTSDLVLDNLNTRRKAMKRSRSAVTFNENQRHQDSSDEDQEDELITLRRDRVKMVYNKEDANKDDFYSHSSKKFASDI